ncbi:MAG: NADH-quinone oxidoreductase subunit H [Candidatus Aenigmarchaeota archaeon]|nr:NADH-quinone oxidoreductase subunit H [Candidatus Aenigmarchaeota archaeon]
MIEGLLLRTALVPIIACAGILLGLLYRGLDRVLVARMQSRVGPPVTQPFRDVKKLLLKENIVPRDAVGWIFNSVPVIALSVTVLILLYLPFIGMEPVLEGHGDLILVIYLLLIPSLALVLGGFSSGSTYATVGAQREMVTMMSYEFPLAVASVSIAWIISAANPGIAAFSLGAIAMNPAWAAVGPLGLLGLALLLLTMLAVMPGELGVAPFDVAEAETEIAGGVLVEYSGRNLAMFYLADAVKAVVLGTIVIALFLPWGIAGSLGITGMAAVAADAIFYLVKLFIVIFVGSIFIRAAIARFRITQVVKAYWGYATFVSLLGLLLISLDMLSRLL